jgi:hypothetical protein
VQDAFLRWPLPPGAESYADIEATGALTFAAASLSLVIVAFVANWIPARRAARIQPVSALRYE